MRTKAKVSMGKKCRLNTEYTYKAEVRLEKNVGLILNMRTKLRSAWEKCRLDTEYAYKAKVSMGKI